MNCSSSAPISHRPDLVAEDRARLGYTVPRDLPTASDYERAGDVIGFEEDRLLIAEDPLRVLRVEPDTARPIVRRQFWPPKSPATLPLKTFQRCSATAKFAGADSR